MTEQWIPLASIPQSGRTIHIDDQKFWEAKCMEYSVPCKIIEKLVAEVFILLQEEGVLFRGKLYGTVTLPCNRCTDETTIKITQQFDSFESYPPDPYIIYKDKSDEELAAQDYDETVIRVSKYGKSIEVNPSALAWQELSLALPVKPVCSSECKGLCPACGCNKNVGNCACNVDSGDPRMAVLRGLKINK